MFNRTADEMIAQVLTQPRRAENGHIITLSASAGENNFTRLALPHLRNIIAEIV